VRIRHDAMVKGGPRLEAQRRRELAQSYLSGAAHYEKVRPGYPAETVDWILPASAKSVADVGAGTGKLTADLVARGLEVTAVDPSADMLAQLRGNLPTVHTVVGIGEDTGLPSASVDAVTVAQAWHWFDPAAASTELARILGPSGRLALIWNQLDVTVPWVHRLARIIHAGDVLKPGFTPPVGPEFAVLEDHATRWVDRLTPPDIAELAKSRSYYLRADSATRQKVMANLHWYLYEHLGHRETEVLELPYFTHSWRTHKR
jgi:SAM-dependent methyltransferase